MFHASFSPKERISAKWLWHSPHQGIAFFKGGEKKRKKEKSIILKIFVQFLVANGYIQIHSNDWKYSWHDKIHKYCQNVEKKGHI